MSDALAEQQRRDRRPLLLGDTSDVHVAALISALQTFGVQPAVIYDLRDAALWLRSVSCNDKSRGQRGLIRSRPVVPDVSSATEQAAWQELADGVAGDPRIEWLSTLAAIRQSDNKLYQLGLAELLDIPFPRTIVPYSRAEISGTIGDEVIVKPLGFGVVQRSGRDLVFYSTLVRAAELEDVALQEAPVLAQELVNARRHLRVVTVESRIWCAGLLAEGLRVDWRESAHERVATWSPANPPKEFSRRRASLGAYFRTRLYEPRLGRGQGWKIHLSGPEP